MTVPTRVCTCPDPHTAASLTPQTTQARVAVGVAAALRHCDTDQRRRTMSSCCTFLCLTAFVCQRLCSLAEGVATNGTGVCVRHLKVPFSGQLPYGLSLVLWPRPPRPRRPPKRRGWGARTSGAEGVLPTPVGRQPSRRITQDSWSHREQLETHQQSRRAAHWTAVHSAARGVTVALRLQRGRPSRCVCR